MVRLVFMGWVSSQANEWEDYSCYFGGGVEISRNWATAPFLTFYGWPQNCHGTDGCVIQLMYYNEHMRLKVYWKSNLPPSWIQLILTSFCHVLWLCNSFKCCACPLLSCFNMIIKIEKKSFDKFKSHYFLKTPRKQIEGNFLELCQYYINY